MVEGEEEIEEKKGRGKKEPKGKRAKKKKKKINKGKLYDVSGEGFARKRKACPKCGAGVFMAEHKDRATCGKCGFTEWKREEKSPSPEV